MKHKQNSWRVLFPTLILLSLAGCVTPVSEPAPTPEPATPPSVKSEPVATPSYFPKPTPEPGSCGSMHDFVLDVQNLNSTQRKKLLDELGSYAESEFSCDRLKTGALLSQIGKTVSEDNLAIEILEQYKTADKLDTDNQQLIRLLSFQSQERKRLHVLLNSLGKELINAGSLNDTLSGELITLQQKINQLQKLETDINETEQSIATPTTSNLDAKPSTDTGN